MAAGFTYPAAALVRRHGPSGYANYASYRPWLRDEFSFRCVYCLVREQWGRVFGEFDLDHYVPQSLDSALALDYDNLLYSCRVCNLGKGDRLLPNPVAELLADQVIVHDDGAIEGSSENVVRLIRILDLDDEEHRRWRRIWIRIVDLAKKHAPPLYQQLLGSAEAGRQEIRGRIGNARAVLVQSRINVIPPYVQAAERLTRQPPSNFNTRPIL